MTIGAFIKRARERLNISQAELARRIGVSKTAVGKWEDGVTAPKRARVIEVARALGIPADQLTPLGNVGFSVVDETESRRHIPLMGWDQFSSVLGNMEPAMLGSLPDIVAYGLPTADVALRITDDSMTGVLDPGDVIIVSRDVDAVADDIVIAHVGNSLLLRRYCPRGTDMRGARVFDLLSTNVELPTITVNSSNPGKVIAVVVETRRQRRSR
jgi:transcriptional regulator with XRE-family HTH domain